MKFSSGCITDRKLETLHLKGAYILLTLFDALSLILTVVKKLCSYGGVTNVFVKDCIYLFRSVTFLFLPFFSWACATVFFMEVEWLRFPFFVFCFFLDF